jgi:ADP-heptose:LPS heptosyltransferase
MISRATFRDRHNYYLGVASELGAPALRLVARICQRGSATPPASWRRGLIIGHTRIGDVLFRTPSLEPLHDGFPKCDWYYLAAEDSAQVLEGNPWVKEVLPLCRGASTMKLKDGAIAALRSLQFDVALCTNGEAYWRDALLALRIGIPSRVGFTHRGLSGVVTHPIPCRFPAPTPAYFRDMVAHLSGRSQNWQLRPRMYPNSDDETSATTAWRRLGFDDTTIAIACFMTTRESSQIWPRDCYRECLKMLKRRQSFQIVVAGAPNERPGLEAFCRDAGFECKLLAGDLDLRPLHCFLRRCAAVLTPDSGPRHISNAAGTPVVFIRNLAGSKVECGVYCETETDVSPDIEFVPPGEQEAFLRQVSPERVCQALLDAIARRTAGAPRMTRP